MRTSRGANDCGFRQAAASGRGRRGVAAAELAVCLPVIVLLVIATIEACSALFLKQSLTVTAYEGVRVALANGSSVDDVENVCRRILKDRKVNGARVTVSPADIASLRPGEYLDVQVFAPCDLNSVIPTTFYRGRTLSATASMMVEH